MSRLSHTVKTYFRSRIVSRTAARWCVDIAAQHKKKLQMAALCCGRGRISVNAGLQCNCVSQKSPLSFLIFLLKRLGIFSPNFTRLLYRVDQKSEPQMLYTQLRQILADFTNSFTVIISRKFAMQHSLNIPPHLKRIATQPCEMFMSENSLLISEIHLIISLHTFSFVKKQRTETSKMIVRYVKVIFFCFNLKYSMGFI